MTSIVRRYRFVTLISVIYLIAGCSTVAFRTGEVPAIDPWPIAMRGGESALIVSVTAVEPKKWSGLKEWENRITTVYSESQLFKGVTGDSTGVDRRIELHVEYHVDVNWGYPILTYVTGGLIPSSQRDRLSLITTILDRDGKQLGTITESITFVENIHVFYTFAWNSPSTEAMYEKTIDDLGRASIIEAHNKGLL